MANLDYKSRLDALKARRQDNELIKIAKDTGRFDTINESYDFLQESDSIKYAIGAMEPVDQKYTSNSYTEGNRIKNHLLKLKGYPHDHDLDFEYQGSVTNNTHIKYHSDIDLLVITRKFQVLQKPLKPSIPYTGNPLDDLFTLRKDCYNILASAFPTVKVDNNGAKSISLKGGSLKRKIDVVPSSWYNTVNYSNTGSKYHRGITILDNKNQSLVCNTPFYHNKLLDDKDIATFKNYKKVIRLLKTLKADAKTNINLSSYDISALIYHMDDSFLAVKNTPLLLIKNSLNYLIDLYKNDNLWNNLYVPDLSRKISAKTSKRDLFIIITELSALYGDINEELKGNIEKQIIA